MLLTLTRPDDWHLHLRDGAALAAVVPHSARRFGRAIVMPNLRPPVTTTAQAAAYRARILAARPPGCSFEPLMTLYLTDDTPTGEIDRAAASGFVRAAKYYPAGATTHSGAGVTDVARIEAVLARMEETGLPLLVHGEVTDPGVDVFDRERVFIERVLAGVVRRFPQLKVVFEHVTTTEAIEFVRDRGSKEQFDVSLGVARRVWLAALENGVIFRPLGGDVIATSPPFVISETQIDRLVDGLDSAIGRVEKEIKALV